jgi:hypothetical protein
LESNSEKQTKRIRFKTDSWRLEIDEEVERKLAI